MPDRGFSIQAVDAALSRQYEPLLKFKWVCDSLPFDGNPMYVESVKLPFIQFDKKDPYFGGAQYSQNAGFTAVNDFDMTFYEDSSASTTLWLIDWQKRIKNFATGAYSLPREYKRPMTFTLIDTTGIDVIRVTLINTWPSVISDLDLDWTSNERVIINVTFAVDEVKIETLRNGGMINSTPGG